MKRQTSSTTLRQKITNPHYMKRNVLSELVIHLSNPLYLHLPALFSSTNPPPLSPVTINNQGIRSEFVILTPAQCDINHLISLVELNVCV